MVWDLAEEIMSLEDEIAGCLKCKNLQNNLKKAPIVYVGRNYDDRRILLIGESPHKTWLDSGNPFSGNNGSLLPSARNIKEYLLFFDASFNDVALIEVVKCVVDERKNLAKMMERCSKYLKKQIEDLNPGLVLLLGQKTTETVSRVYSFEPIMNNRVVVSGIEFGSLYHPSPINPNNHKRNINFLEAYVRN